MSDFQHKNMPEERMQFASLWTASSPYTGAHKDPKINTNDNFTAENIIYSSFGNGYVLDSDLETIEEESSIYESELDDRLSDTRDGNSGSLEQDSTYGGMPNYTPPTEHDIATTTKQPTGAIDPNAHERIVYAKCLSPENARHVKKSAMYSAQSVKQQVPTANRQHGLHDTHTATTPEYFAGEIEKNELPISHMFEAVRIGNLLALDRFSVAEQNETVDERGNTILHAASAAGQLNAMTHLVNGSFKEMVSPLNDDMMTPTALAVKHGHFRCVQWMIDNTKAKGELIVSSRQSSIDGSNTRPPLIHVAARNGQYEILDWICEKMTKENHPIDAANHHSDTAAHEAAAYGHMKCLQILVGRGASVNTLNSSGDTPGQVADKNGHDLCVGYLVVVETCMSLAQQLIAVKLENEGVREENKMLRSKIQDIHEAGLAHAKESVEKRINATLLQNVPSSEKNKDEIQAKDSEIMSTKRKTEFHENAVQTKNDFTSLEMEDAGSHGLFSANVSATGAKMESSVDRAQETNSPRHICAELPVLSSKSHPSHTFESMNEDEIQKFAQGSKANLNDRGNKTLTSRPKTRTRPTPAAKAWEKMAMDDVLKLARDSRYLPSPTISVCTEDSTMETREAMRDRLAEASRWFLVQQSIGKPNIKSLPLPRHRQRSSRSGMELAKSVANSVGRISLWESRFRNPTQHRAPQQEASQTLIAATNREYGLLKLQDDKNSLQTPQNDVAENTRTNMIPNYFLVRPVESNSDELARSSSDKSSSSIISSTIAGSTSTLSKSTSTSQETVTEEKSASVRNEVDPLHKKLLLGSPSRASPRDSGSFDDTRSTGHRVDHKVTNCSQLLTSTDSAVVRVVLPTRNNSFLRKVQPTSTLNQAESLSQPGTKFSYPVVIPSPPVLSSAIPSVNQPNKTAQSPNGHSSIIRQKETSNKGTFMWKTRSATVSENNDLNRASGDAEQATVTDAKKLKSTLKSTHKGLFGSSPASSRKKTLKLFHF